MNRVIQSELLNSFSFIQHGFLTRHFGTDQVKGISVRSVCRVKQVHGNTVAHVTDLNQLPKLRQTEADIIITKIPDTALIISTADCVPLLFCDPIKKVIAAAHAGWRGTAKEVAKTTVQAMIELYHCDPKNIGVAIGPAIQYCCYEVDSKVYDSFSEKEFFKPVPKKKGHWTLSLSQLNHYQLIRSGILDENIWISTLCTACHTDQFYSYRKEGDKASRQWSYIALR